MRATPWAGALRDGPAGGHDVAYVLKVFPRLSETFILAELRELERQGMRPAVFSARRPVERLRHAEVDRLAAPVHYPPAGQVARIAAFVGASAWLLARHPVAYLAALAEAVGRRRRSSLRHFADAVRMAPAVSTSGARHVHAHFASTATSVAVVLARLLDLPYSFTAHAKDIFRDGVDRAALARRMEAARFVVTVSDFNRAYLGDLLARSGREARLHRVYNGLDLERFAPADARRDAPPLVLAVGRLVEKKGFDDLVRACAVLRGEGRRFRCLVVGTGDQRAELERLMDELDVRGVVELGGPRPREELLDLYPRATAFAAPCVVGADGNRDGLPTVIIEAMALGVPVVATPVTGIPELVVDGRTGLLVPERDPAALAGALGRLIDEPDLGRALAAEGRRVVETSFDLRTNAGELARLFGARTR